jgi:nitric oxide synthase-interacting protein
MFNCGTISPKGHLACKECFYENILAQKKDIERALKQAEAQKRQAEEEEKEKIRQAQEILLKEFEQTLTNVRADTKHTTLANAASGKPC